MALAFADAMNTQHEAGFDANGDAGGKLFNFGSPAVLSNSKNGGSLLRPL
jgi:flagellar hook-associated protein 1 FlgK